MPVPIPMPLLVLTRKRDAPCNSNIQTIVKCNLVGSQKSQVSRHTEDDASMETHSDLVSTMSKTHSVILQATKISAQPLIHGMPESPVPAVVGVPGTIILQ